LLVCGVQKLSFRLDYWNDPWASYPLIMLKAAAFDDDFMRINFYKKSLAYFIIPAGK
jgi:hypothetical protein